MATAKDFKFTLKIVPAIRPVPNLKAGKDEQEVIEVG